jgi:SagB-type dehydrogenase family enzyme
MGTRPHITFIIAALMCALCTTGCGFADGDCTCDAACDVECESSCEEDASTDPAGGEDVGEEPPALDDVEAIRRVIHARRSFREFTDEPITSEDIADLMWAAQGITLPERGFRASPSAGATYPLEFYVAADNVEGMDPGLYWYTPDMDRLVPTGPEGALASTIASAALGQECIQRAAAIIVIAAVFERTTTRYLDRGIMYVHMEVGHASENLILMATARGLGSVPVGAFYEDTVAAVLELPPDQEVLYLIPVGQMP